MAGHSKFKNIMHRKGRADAVRARNFTKLAREITTAAKGGMPDPAMNPRLRLAVANARAESMPKENIDRAIKKAIGGDAESYDEIRYEGFGPGGVGLIVEVLTDNRNRAAANVRTIFAKNGGAMGETGSVSFMFDRAGAVNYPSKTGSEDEVMEAAIEAGAEDVESDVGTDQWDEGEGHTVYTGFAEMNEVAGALEARFGPARSTRAVWRPKSQTPVTGDDVAAVVRLIDALEEDDDVQHVYSNAEFSDDDLAAMSA